MEMIRMPGLPRCVDSDGILQILQIDDHAHGWEPVGLVTIFDRPAGCIDDRIAAAGGEGSAVEERFDGRDARFAEGTVPEGGGVHFAPVPRCRISTEYLFEF